MTGGLQEQVTDGKQWFGIGIDPSSKAVIGSQSVPYINEDRVSKEDFISALKEMYNMPRDKRQELGKKGRAHIENNYNFDTFNERWIEIIDQTIEKHRSWGERRGYQSWQLKEIA